MKNYLIFICTFLSVGFLNVFADEIDSNHEIIVTPIEINHHSQTVVGQNFEYPNGTPAIYPYHIFIKKNAKTKWHIHQVPLVAYIISGTLTVDYGTKGRFDFSEGMSFIEALDWCHQGSVSSDEGAEIFALYLARLDSKEKKSKDCDGN
tara:strand:+ start:551 stop:997 length:447 start_codon:yes stop_codon:yes gene_type:complete